MPSFEDIALRASEGLTLTSFAIDDVPALLRAVDDEELRRWLPLPTPYTRELAESWCMTLTRELRESGRGLILAVREDDEFAGCIDAKRIDWRAMTAEIGYWTSATHRGRGLMPAAVKLLSTWLIDECGFARVELRIATQNQSSLRVAEKSGFVREGVARNAGFTDSGRVDLAVYSRVTEDVASR